MASAAGTRALLACGIVGVCAAFAVLRATAAHAQANGSGGGDPSVTVPAEVRDLWREYPLNPTPPPAAPPQPTISQPITESESSGAEESGSKAPAFAIAAALGVAAIGIGALVVRVVRRPAWAVDVRPAKQFQTHRPSARVRTTRRQERPMDDRLRRIFDAYVKPRPSRSENYRRPNPEISAPSEETDKPELDSAAAGERSDTVTTSEPSTPENADANNYAQVGEQVAAVLASAHQAAEQIRATAREEAERIRAEAENSAAYSQSEANGAAEQVRRESEALRAEAEEYSREVREAADLYVANTRQRVEDEAAERRTEIDQQAREIHRAAEQRARDLETEALRRQKALVEEAGRSEARLRQLLDVFRGMTAQLEELVGAERTADDALEAQDGGRAEELSEDLLPNRSRTEPV